MFDQGPPDHVIPFGEFQYPCENDLVCKAQIENVPYFNAPIYLENKEQVGKVDEIFGNIRDYYITVKLGECMKADNFKKKQTLFIDPNKLLPLARFLPAPPGQKRGVGKPGGGRGKDLFMLFVTCKCIFHDDLFRQEEEEAVEVVEAASAGEEEEVVGLGVEEEAAEEVEVEIVEALEAVEVALVAAEVEVDEEAEKDGEDFRKVKKCKYDHSYNADIKFCNTINYLKVTIDFVFEFLKHASRNSCCKFLVRS